MEHDAEQAEEIRHRKFEFHNSKWISVVNGGTLGSEMNDYDENVCMDLYFYHNYFIHFYCY